MFRKSQLYKTSLFHCNLPSDQAVIHKNPPAVAHDVRGWVHYIEYERREYSADCVGSVSLRIFF